MKVLGSSVNYVQTLENACLRRRKRRSPAPDWQNILPLHMSPKCKLPQPEGGNNRHLPALPFHTCFAGVLAVF